MTRLPRALHIVPAAAFSLLVVNLFASQTFAIDGIVGSQTYRPEVVGRVGVVAAGRHFAAEAGVRQLARGGHAGDARGAAPVAGGRPESSPLRPGGGGPGLRHPRGAAGA